MNYYLKKARKIVCQIPSALIEKCKWICLCLSLLALFDIEKLKAFQLWGISDIATTFENFCGPIMWIFDNRIVKILIYGATIFAFVLSACQKYIRPKAIVLRHSSFSNHLSGYDTSIMSGYSVKEFEIDLVNQMTSGNILKAINDQDEILQEVQKSSDENSELFYYGIAHIPLIFRAGFQVGDEGQSRLFHTFRDAGPLFKEVATDQDNYAIRLAHSVKDRRNISSSNEMLVVIATSLEVKPMDLFALRQKDFCCELYFKPEDGSQYGFDNIASYPTMRRLKDGILREIRKQSAEYNVQKIHLILSTSSDFTFYLAEGFSQHHDPEIIVYQYERNSDVKYPWGISNIAPPENAVFYVS